VLDKEQVAELLNDYVDGRLGPDDTRKLLHILETSEEQRDRLALISIVERLLASSRADPVPTARVMEAVRTERQAQADMAASRGRGRLIVKRRDSGNAQVRHGSRETSNRTRSSYRQSAALAPAITILLCASAILGLAWWLHRAAEEPPPRTSAPTKAPEPVARPPAPEPPAPATQALPPESATPSAPAPPVPQEAPPPASVGRLSAVRVIHNGEWDTRRGALPTLLQSFHRRTDVPVELQVGAMRLSGQEIFEAPMLYVTGHEAFRLKRGEAAQLRRYLLSGGFVFAEACCGRKGFDRAFRAQIRTVLPQRRLVPIPESHPVFNVPNRIGRLRVTPRLANRIGTLTARPRMEGIEIQDHYAVIYSPYGMAGSWEMSQKPDAYGYADGEAVKLGQNILLYAVTQ